MSEPVILVVDDAPFMRGLLARALPVFGFKVLLAGSGEEAVDLFRERRGDISLVLLDVCMPRMDGPATLLALRELDPEVRCCFMTAAPGRHTTERLLGFGALHVFPKPFAMAEMAESLWGALEPHISPGG